ncbi:MAG: hypothetical protein AAGA53_12620 [Pseudomonadota bacterium]
MLKTPNISISTPEKISEAESEAKYDTAERFFAAPQTKRLAESLNAAPTKDQNVNDQGTVQFSLIGQKPPAGSQYSDIMLENQDNLLGIGGLMHNYIKTHYPTITADKLDISTWTNVVNHIPDCSVGKASSKTFNHSVKGVSVSGQFLQMIANAIITDGASLLTDFNKYLAGVGDLVFTKTNTNESYKALTCTYQSYLVNNGLGGYYDYGAIVLRQIDFTEHFQQLKSACATASSIDINMSYQEITTLVQCRNIRKGGRDYDKFQKLVNASATSDFENADNFFNGASTPEDEIKPQV